MKNRIIMIYLIFGIFKISSFAYDSKYLSIHGFGTLGGAYQDNENIIYKSSLNTEKGANGDFSLANYSIFGLQVDAKPIDDLTLTIQGVASENNGNKNLVELAWANIKYQLTDTLEIRAGKMRQPIFMFSDVLTVSYAYDFLRLPDMYSLIPISNYTGVELYHSTNLDNLTIESSLLYGSSKSRLSEYMNVKAKNLYIASLKFLFDDFNFRVLYSKNDFSVNHKIIDPVVDKFNALKIPVISDAVDKYKIKDTSFIYLSIGARYDFEDAYLLGEYMKYDTASFMSDIDSWYIGGGYNIGNWTPYLLYSNTSSKQNYKDIEVSPNMPAQAIGAINLFNQAFHIFQKSTTHIVDTKSVGIRYNLMDNISLNFQYDKQIHDRDTAATNNEKLELDIYNATISFVF